jgi:hypothetical protein
LLTAIAAFAEAFVNPLAPILAFALAVLVQRPAYVRLMAGACGALLSAFADLHSGPVDLGLALTGGAAALLLHAEIVLHLILPLLRWVRRCLVAAWELTWLVLSVMSRLIRRGEPGSPSNDEERS